MKQKELTVMPNRATMPQDRTVQADCAFLQFNLVIEAYSMG